MDFIRHVSSENDTGLDTFVKPNSSSLKPSSTNDFKANNTPSIQRRKLGNLSNTPVRLLKDHTNTPSMKKNTLDDFKKGLKVNKEINNSLQQKSEKKKKIINTLPTVYEGIENSHPLSDKDWFQENYPSEYSDYFVDKYHPQLLSCPFDDDDEERAEELKRIRKMSVEDYFDGFL